MLATLAKHGRDPDQWDQLNRNAGLRQGWLYSLIVNKTLPPILTGWLAEWFEEPSGKHELD